MELIENPSSELANELRVIQKFDRIKFELNFACRINPDADRQLEAVLALRERARKGPGF